jgi:diguanylate cyclase (GGDEF)-like protein
VISDLIARRAAYKVFFNAGQLALAVVAAALVQRALRAEVGTDEFSGRYLAVMFIAGGAFYLANNLLTSGVIVIALGERFLSLLRNDMMFQAATTLVLLSLAPLVIAVQDDNVLLIFLFVPAILALHRSARSAVQRDHDALHDPLTGLANRAQLARNVDQMLAGNDVHGLSMVIAGLDRFGELNNTLGFAFGDILLNQVAERLERTFGGNWSVARVGGDEFAVAGPEPEEGSSLGTQVSRAFVEAFDLDGTPFFIEASVGSASAPDDGNTALELVQRASVALDTAKTRRAGVVRYTSAIDRFRPERLSLMSQLRHALDDDQFVLQFQPQISIADRTVAGVEALVRWEHPDLGRIQPDTFIPLVESTGLVHEFTRTVAFQAIRTCREWRDRGHDLTVAINLSGRNLTEPDLAADLASMLTLHSLPAAALEVEITETAAIEDLDAAIETLGQIRDLGILIAIDDFGTGQSSLRYLSRLPVDVVKIDKSFVSAMLTDLSCAAIVHAVIEISESLGVVVVAEGVESEAEWNALSAAGCDIAQGYYISRPLDPPDFANWLRMTHYHVVGRSSRPPRQAMRDWRTVA